MTRTKTATSSARQSRFDKSLAQKETSAPDASNFLLDRLPGVVRNRLGAQLAPISLSLGQILHKPGDKIRTLYFPTTCMISVKI